MCDLTFRHTVTVEIIFLSYREQEDKAGQEKWVAVRAKIGFASLLTKLYSIIPKIDIFEYR